MKKIILIIIIYTIPISIFSQVKDSLDYYIEYGVKYNPELNAEYKSYEASLEKVPQLKSLPDPNLSFGYFISPVETRLGPQKAKLSLTQMFPWFGTLDAKGKQAAYLAKAKFEVYRSSENKLEYSIKNEYFNLYLIKNSIEYILIQIDLLEMLEKQALIKSETGQTSIVDVLQFQMAKDELVNKVKNLRNDEEDVISRFNLLLNRGQSIKVFIPDTIYPIKEIEFSIDTIIQNNPRIKSSDHLIDYSEYLVKESKLSAYPKLGVGLDYVFVGERQDINPENNGKDIIMPMVSMSIPIFGKKYKAKIKESKLKNDAFILKKESVENNLMTEFETKIMIYNSALNDYKLYNTLITKAEQALNILKTAYETSGKDYDQVLSLQKKVLDFRINELKALTKIKITQSYLEYLSKN